jgi:hypothetical protein
MPFRQAGSNPWISVQEASAVFQKYQIIESLFETDPQDLKDNTWTATAYQTIDASNCIINEVTNWWRFKTTGLSTILIEVDSASGASIFINQDHVTYLWGTWQITRGLTYDKLLIDNMDWVGTYYIHVPNPDPNTLIRITEWDQTSQSLSLSTRVDLGDLDSYKPMSFQTSLIKPDLDPSEHLYLSFTSYSGIDVWVTRGRFSDKTRAISLSPSPGDFVTDISPVSTSMAVPHCRLLEDNDVYFINMMRTTKTVDPALADLPLLVRADLESRSIAMSNAAIQKSGSIPSYSTRRTTYTLTSLSADSIIYFKFDNIDFGLLSNVIIFKGPVDTSLVDTTSVPTDAGSACSVCTDHELIREAAWLDDCWHCHAIDTVYVDVSVSDAYLQRTTVDYTLTQKVVTWKSITSSSSSFDLEGSILSYDFFTVQLPSDSGTKIIVEVTSGSLVTVELMPTDCSKRTPANMRSVDCLLGFQCEIYTTKSNIVGLSGDYRIVISGEDVQGTIYSQTGDALCTGLSASSAPFCSGVLSGTVVGDSASIPQKDAFAEAFYDSLVLQFDASYGCGFSDLPDKTESDIKTYACQYSMPACNNGYGRTPDYSLCVDIVDSTGVPFSSLSGPARPELECEHNFYNGGVVWVGPGDDNKPADSNDKTGASAGPNLLLALLIIPIIVIILIIILIVYFITRDQDGAPPAGDGQYNQT